MTIAKKIVALSIVAATAVTSAYAVTDAEFAKLQKQVKSLKKSLTKVKKHDGGDNLKLSVDLRTAMDNIGYKSATGDEFGSGDLMTTRLILNMASTPTENLIFMGALSYNKVFGANPPAGANTPNGQNGYPQRGAGFDTFDWVVNENLIDNNLKVKEAFWLYLGDSFLGTDVSWTASVGRRPSTDGFLGNYRENVAKGKSPLAHTINVEFDGASFLFKLGEVTGVEGMSFKICLGRGLTNARSRFNMDGGFAAKGDYSSDNTTIKNINLFGFIFVPYDDGQYKLMTNWYRGTDVPGYNMVDQSYLNGLVQGNKVTNTGMVQFSDDNSSWSLNSSGGMAMKGMGDQDGLNLSFLADGVGDGINDFLDDTKMFISYAQSTTHPNNDGGTVDMAAMMATMKANNMTLKQAFTAMANGTMDPTPFMKDSGMLGSTKSETGSSIWIGANFPAMFTEEGRIGIEYNQGSQYWRPFTYGEDTLAGSKMAVRGSAMEVYYNQPLIDNYLVSQIRYTSINYDYTGSQGFFGDDGKPMKIDDAKAMGMDPIESATDIRYSISYRY